MKISGADHDWFPRFNRGRVVHGLDYLEVSEVELVFDDEVFGLKGEERVLGEDEPGRFFIESNGGMSMVPDDHLTCRSGVPERYPWDSEVFQPPIPAVDVHSPMTVFSDQEHLGHLQVLGEHNDSRVEVESLGYFFNQYHWLRMKFECCQRSSLSMVSAGSDGLSRG